MGSNSLLPLYLLSNRGPGPIHLVRSLALHDYQEFMFCTYITSIEISSSEKNQQEWDEYLQQINNYSRLAHRWVSKILNIL